MVTLDQFVMYEILRWEGKFNMVMDAKKVASLMKLSIREYFDVIHKYSEFLEKYSRMRFRITTHPTDVVVKDEYGVPKNYDFDSMIKECESFFKNGIEFHVIPII